ncbi:carbohydrate ABC transporter substrate-binding protein, CUT1 family [Clostridium pasteurianum DSM 525 = ATCC 6013]|uniref:Carbohydrate ABC transporter substrate-binding protein, CUT1 family n=1 Tax=Clostridium pasteurianum DSM 525 = ATCC 6013 TaxID=1262449 RepID=A0A0H3IXW9_CLOPA|nr:ABC transporter substrate-binding protein [Clostridium pasteurianum]AJA46336.1 carbohydrate ABC transporter substrate-binding protein, CUT1 family [Clostridium pasteurianum DSM 525 = ATCC 6013]AJA50324.1 carbohydrate ABC transporter substrate-binding protein, CUT1 family [Clostridium pasteurianum DSM 525 = ATCC 6013]AOZ73778.1 sugar ABC transporter substrate-binding protein [Clostridium pasteurianum DSM 525 = ATCC 6013]AOZ77575.1 sugar ABC transporter substrate-binding protein [Clostridium p
MKKIISILIIFLVNISLISCETASNSSNVEKLSGKVTIWTTDANAALINDAAALFRKRYPEVSINVSYSDVNTALDSISKSSKENVHLPDIMIVRDKNIPVVLNKAQNNILDASEIPQFKKDKFIKNQINNNTYKNRIYAVPWYVEPTIMLYREDILKSLNIKSDDIKTWKQYIDIGNNILKPEGKAMLSSMDINDGTIYDLLLSQLGVSYFNNNENIDLLNEKSVRAAGILNEIYKSKISRDSTDKIQSFINGDAISLICNVSTMYNIESKYPDLKDKIRIQKIPAFEPGGNRDNINFGDNLMLLKSSKSNSAALQFVQFLSSDKEFADYEFKRYGFISSDTTSYVEDSFYKKNEFYNKYIGIMAVDEILGLRNMKYEYNFNIIRDKSLKTIIDASANNKPLNESLYNLQTALEQSDELK